MNLQAHELKTIEPYFSKVWDGLKTFELRKDDRDFCIGDYLILRRYYPKSKTYDGLAILARVDYLFRGPKYGLLEDHCIMSLKIITQGIYEDCNGWLDRNFALLQ